MASGMLFTRAESPVFQPDAYSSYRVASYWLRFEHPFWWTNLLTALDSLARMGFSAQDGQICKGLDWLREHQEESGLWRISYANPDEKQKDTAKIREMKLWVSLAVCWIYKRLYGQELTKVWDKSTLGVLKNNNLSKFTGRKNMFVNQKSFKRMVETLALAAQT